MLKLSLAQKKKKKKSLTNQIYTIVFNVNALNDSDI